MAFVAAPNCVSLAIIWDLDGQAIENTYHYRYPAPATVTNLAQIATETFIYWATVMGDCSASLELVKCYVRALDSSSAPTWEANPSSTIVGTDSTSLQPNNVTFAVTRFSGSAGRANRGRVYWPGITADMRAGANDLSAAQAHSFVVALTGFKDAIFALSPAATEIILHKATGTHVDVLGYRYSDLHLDSQRRRLPGHNIHH